RAKLTDAQKADRRSKNILLNEDLTATQKGYIDSARSLAKKHGRSVSWTKSQLFIGGKFTRQPLPQGRRWKLRDYVKAHMTTLQHDYRKLNSSEKNILRQGLDKTQEKRVKLVRSNPKAMAKYVDKTFDDMDRDWTGIANRTSMQMMYLAVRSGVDQLHEPKM
ncbi:hypothetical protein OH76DRAFT_1318693, partial [Lentinus brumalis]